MSDDNVQVRFGAEVDGIIAGVNEVKEQIEGLASYTQGIIGTFSELSEAIGAAFAVEQIVSFIEKLTDLGLQTERTSQQLSLTTEQVGLLNYTAGQFDVPAEQVRHGLERLEQGLQMAARGGNEQAAAFQLMGVNAQEFIARGGTTWELIQKWADATAKLYPTTNLASVYISAMGRTGADLIPVFNELGGNMDEFRARAESAGVVLSQAMVDDLEGTQQGLKNLGSSITGMSLAIFENFKPAFDEAVAGLTSFVQWVTEAASSGGPFQQVLQGIDAAIGGLETSIIGLVAILEAVWDTAKEVFTDIALNAITAGRVIHDALKGDWNAVKDDLKELDEAAKENSKNLDDSILKNAEETVAKWKKLWVTTGSNPDGPSKGESDKGKKSPNLANGTTEQLAQWQAQLTAQLEQQKLFYDAARNYELQFWQQKLQIAKQGTDEYNQIEAKIYELEKEQENESVQIHLKALEQMQVANKNDYAKVQQLEQQKLAYLKQIYGQNSQQYQQELLKQQQMDTQHLQQTQQKYAQMFNGIFRSFNSAIEGMVRGTETLGQAVSDIFWGIAESVFEVLEKIAAKWIAEQIVGETAASTQAITSIGASAAQAGAAAYASTAAIPIIGPELAPAAAAAAYAGAIAYEGLASFDIGAWNVPGDRVAKIHEGEMILPKPFAQSFRENGGLFSGGAGGDIHFHVQAWDTRDMARWFRNNGDMVAGGIKSAKRNNNRDLARFGVT
jgi:hypothetical protein